MESFWEAFCEEVDMSPDELTELASAADDILPSPSSSDSDITDSLTGSPCTDFNSTSSDEADDSCKKKRSRRQKCPLKKKKQRAAANVRERRRMKSINDAFDGLRQCVPEAASDKKLSKVDTLRMAIRYISELSRMVEELDSVMEPGTQQHPADRNKVIIRYPNGPLDQENFNWHSPSPDAEPLLGHSLSWKTERSFEPGPDNKLSAKIWMPESPSCFEADVTSMMMCSMW